MAETAERAAEQGLLATHAPATGFDLVVCDINGHPGTCARAIEAALPWCTKNAALLLTLKMVRKGGHSTRALEAEAREALSAHWDIIAIEQLFANGRHERTLTARRRR